MDDFSLPPIVPRPVQLLKGRGVSSAVAHRFSKDLREWVDDGWGGTEECEAEPPRPATEVITESARSALSRNDSPDIAFDQAINPYRGCEHVIRREGKCSSLGFLTTSFKPILSS